MRLSCAGRILSVWIVEQLIHQLQTPLCYSSTARIDPPCCYSPFQHKLRPTERSLDLEALHRETAQGKNSAIWRGWRVAPAFNQSFFLIPKEQWKILEVSTITWELFALLSWKQHNGKETHVSWNCGGCIHVCCEWIRFFCMVREQHLPALALMNQEGFQSRLSSPETSGAPGSCRIWNGACTLHSVEVWSTGHPQYSTRLYK